MYGEDLAYIHDVGFGDFAKNSGPQLVEILRRFGLTSGLVVDLGCGSGIWASFLVENAYDVLGVDISPSMVKLAKKRAPKATFLCSSFLDMSLPQCSAITSLGECLSYLFDDKNSISALRRLFIKCHKALQPNGLLIFDVVTPEVMKRKMPYKSFWENEKYSILVEYFDDPKKRVSRRGITTFRKVGDLYRRHYEEHKQLLFTGSELANCLREVGFKTRIVRSYGSYQLLPGRVALIARKSCT